MRRYIHRKFTDKQYLTLRTLLTELITEGIILERTSQTVVSRLIHSVGFKYKVTHLPQRDCTSERNSKKS